MPPLDTHTNDTTGVFKDSLHMSVQLESAGIHLAHGRCCALVGGVKLTVKVPQREKVDSALG
jgi:hypothetical protein